IGSTNLGTKRNLSRRFKFLRQEGIAVKTDLKAIVNACEKMGKSKTGAIIVLKRSNALDFVKSSGDDMFAEVNQPLLESIFFKNSPLHDGATVIENNHITATRVILPVSNKRSIPLRFGLRHRAAVGITERTDALALVVSEETGNISYVKNGEFIMYKDLKDLEGKLQKDLM
ncbi:MAG: TIGR00159 family protein, partial [Eudoraea sp.]|nr:DNA integrity scanning protein DisA nucleotide-binding domain protein [Eudoraea sp.]NNJ41418.1 TIGR00159 family protein [Eudoraea sp.]